jgi:hypothetical protein
VPLYSTRYYGLETWFTLPDLKTMVAPPKWKMAIVTFIGAYRICSLAQHFLNLYLRQSPLLANTITTIILGRSYLFRNACLESIAATLFISNKLRTFAAINGVYRSPETLKDMVILVVSFITYITWMTKTLTHFRTIVELFKFVVLNN